MSVVLIPRRRSSCNRTQLDRAVLTPALRQRIGDAIDALLAVLDAADLDPDFEDSHDAEVIDECEPDDEGDVLDQGEHDDAEIAERWHALA